MKIKLTPSYRDYLLDMDREGDVLMLNGEVFDFSPLLEGATLPAEAISSEWFKGEVTRVGGELEMTILLPHGLSAPESTRFATELVVTQDGTVDLPVYDEVVEDEQHQLEPDGNEGDEGSAGAGGAEDSGYPGTPEQEVGS